jgi:predicted phosphodiesterase
MEYARNWQPDDVIIGGDFVDFKDVSTWKDDPRRMTFKDEVDHGRAMLIQLRDFFPTQRMIYIEGNHEHRLARYMWLKAPELCRFPEMAFERLMDLEPLGIEYISNIERMNNGLLPFKLGKLFVLHGHEVNMSFTGVNLARTLYLKTHVNVIFGHHHQSQHFIFKKLDNTHEGAWMVGGLCKLSENYQPINNWVNGFCTIKYNPVTGYFKIRNKMIIEGQVL